MNTELQLKECYEAGIRKGKKEMQSIIDKLNEEKANCGNCSFISEKIKEKQKEMLDVINKIENPYPKDVFPEVELSEFQSHIINDFLCSNLRITLDRFSAELMRRARNNLLEELKQKLEGLK